MSLEENNYFHFYLYSILGGGDPILSNDILPIPKGVKRFEETGLFHNFPIEKGFWNSESAHYPPQLSRGQELRVPIR